MGSISVSNDFSSFSNNLRLGDSVVQTIQERYHRITKRINLDYWSTDSETSHSLYVGSYGRGTAIFASDVDIVVEIPWSQYSRYNDYSGNGQSAFLQDVKNSLKKTYSASSIRADGQVIVIDFMDGIKFEIVPSFVFSDDGSYYYPDTNNGGKWRKMNPRAEIDAIRTRDKALNGNVRYLARMIRAWNNNMTVLMSGYLIDVTVCRFLAKDEYKDKSFTYHDWMSRDYFNYLINNADKEYWVFPGSGTYVKPKYSFVADARKAYNLCLEAIEAYDMDYSYAWHQRWREIYGNKFPSI